jgi:hypothetical protein
MLLRRAEKLSEASEWSYELKLDGLCVVAEYNQRRARLRRVDRPGGGSHELAQARGDDWEGFRGQLEEFYAR